MAEPRPADQRARAPEVWSERVRTALARGIKENRWFSLVDKVYADLGSGLGESAGQRRWAAAWIASR